MYKTNNLLCLKMIYSIKHRAKLKAILIETKFKNQYQCLTFLLKDVDN